MYRILVFCGISILFTEGLCGTLKVVTGRPRPCFFDLCGYPGSVSNGTRIYGTPGVVADISKCTKTVWPFVTFDIGKTERCVQELPFGTCLSLCLCCDHCLSAHSASAAQHLWAEEGGFEGFYRSGRTDLRFTTSVCWIVSNCSTRFWTLML